MHQGAIQSRQGNSGSEQVPVESICICRSCDHGLARDCAKVECGCCKKEDHSMVMDGIEGFFATDK